MLFEMAACYVEFIISIQNIAVYAIALVSKMACRLLQYWLTVEPLV